ncbi:MAG: CapA family protein [Patescibacteria group bacterium]|nr:CapA family protein [Patescibacteria group bacterium]
MTSLGIAAFGYINSYQTDQVAKAGETSIVKNTKKQKETPVYFPGAGLPEGGQITRLMFVGDIMLSRAVGSQMEKQNDWSWPFLKIADFSQQADILFGNLEGPISARGADRGSPYSFRANPRVIEGLKLAGFDVLSLANNHALDWGKIALEDTLNILEENNIQSVGADHNSAQAQEVKIIEKNNIKFGWLAYTPFVNNFSRATLEQVGLTDFNREKIIEDVSKAKNIVDILIVSYHFGEEYQKQANNYQRELARLTVDSGADLIIGHHPHVVQDIEKYQDAFIVYSLGNFIFDQTFSKETMEGIIFEVIFEDKNIIEIHQIPTVISNSLQVSLASE